MNDERERTVEDAYVRYRTANRILRNARRHRMRGTGSQASECRAFLNREKAKREWKDAVARAKGGGEG